MATLSVQNGEYQIVPGDTLQKIASSGGVTLQELLASNPQYQKNPNLIIPGQTVHFGSTPSYQNLTAPTQPTQYAGGLQPNDSRNQFNTATGQPNPSYNSSPQSTPTSMNDLLTQIFKQAQQSNSNQYTGNNTALLKGKENIQATNSQVYSQDLNNANITNEARLVLLGSDSSIQNPGLQSITDQQSNNLAKFNSNQTNINTTMDAYQKEQDRIAQATRDLADAKYKADTLAETIRAHKADESAARAKIVSSGGGSSSGGSSSTTGTSGTVSGDVKDILEGRNTMYNIRQTMGRTNKAAAYMEQIRNQIRKVDPNFDFVASDAGGKSVSTSYVQKATAAINSVLPNIQKITDLSNQVPRIGITGVDGLIQKAGLVLNNKKVSNFHEAQKLIADEIGVALGAGTVSDMKLQLGFDVTNPNVSAEVFASNMEVVKEFLNNRKAGLNSLRYSSSTSQNSAPSGGSGDPLGIR